MHPASKYQLLTRTLEQGAPVLPLAHRHCIHAPLHRTRVLSMNRRYKKNAIVNHPSLTIQNEYKTNTKKDTRFSWQALPWANANISYLFSICVVLVLYVQAWLFVCGTLLVLFIYTNSLLDSICSRASRLATMLCEISQFAIALDSITHFG